MLHLWTKYCFLKFSPKSVSGAGLSQPSERIVCAWYLVFFKYCVDVVFQLDGLVQVYYSFVRCILCFVFDQKKCVLLCPQGIVFFPKKKIFSKNLFVLSTWCFFGCFFCLKNELSERLFVFFLSKCRGTVHFKILKKTKKNMIYRYQSKKHDIWTYRNLVG